MPLMKFSDAIARLYASAAEFDPEHFPRRTLEVMRELVDIDGGVFGKSNPHGNAPSGKSMMFDQAYVYQRNPAILNEYLDIVEANPGIALHAQENPANVDCVCDFGDSAHAPLAELALHHSVRHLLLIAGLRAGRSGTIWLTLFRADDTPFSASELDMLQSAWPHILQAHRINLQQALLAMDPYGSTRPLGLVNRWGILEAASATMIELIRCEWPGHDGARLTLPVLNALIEHGRYRGSRIEITATPRYGYLACLGRRAPVLHALSPSQRAVAEKYARGLGHKEIASQLKVSPSTVRNHLAHVYQKLGIHSKAELAHSLSSRQAR